MPGPNNYKRWENEPDEGINYEACIQCLVCREHVEPSDYNSYFECCEACAQEQGLDEEQDREERERMREDKRKLRA